MIRANNTIKSFASHTNKGDGGIWNLNPSVLFFLSAEEIYMPTRIISLFLLLASCCPVAIAEMVERTDQNGVVYFSPSQSATEVIMYGDPGCSYCRQARQYFRNNDIEYVEYNIHSSAGRMKEFRSLGGRGTPLIIIGDRKIHGFSKSAIEAALNSM